MWTREKEDKLILMWNSGSDKEEISMEIGKSVSSIMTHASRLKLGRRNPPGRKRLSDYPIMETKGE